MQINARGNDRDVPCRQQEMQSWIMRLIPQKKRVLTVLGGAVYRYQPLIPGWRSCATKRFSSLKVSTGSKSACTSTDGQIHHLMQTSDIKEDLSAVLAWLRLGIALT